MVRPGQGGLAGGPKEAVEPASLTTEVEPRARMGAELESGGGLTSICGPMIQDWGPEVLENDLQVWLGRSGWSESCNSSLYGWEALLCSSPRSIGPGWSPLSSVQPVAGAWAESPIDSEGKKESGGSTRDITIAFRCGRGQGCISKETVHTSPALLPPFPSFPSWFFSSLPFSLLPSFPPSLIQLVWCPTWNPTACAARAGKLLGPQDWEDSVQMSITCEF